MGEGGKWGGSHRLCLPAACQVGEDECIDACIRSSYSSLDPVIAFHFLALAPFRNFFSLAAATAVICGTRQEAEAAVAEEEE